jgi:hypothetical protein
MYFNVLPLTTCGVSDRLQWILGVEVHMVNLGGLLAKAVEFRDPRLMLQLGSHKGTWSSV